MSFASSNFSEASTSNQQTLSSRKYVTYASAVEKALKSFENTTEWADLISALGKLGKAFSTNSKNFNDIPHCVTVAKRLSQCLHPLLPSGVHSKALDTYSQVFLILRRTENLPKYLYLFAIGLFPLMDHCGIKVKLELLSIFEKYLLPLGAALRPALPGFIAAVLLGLEEGTEFYERFSELLETLIDLVGAESFYACFWQAVHGSSSVRLPALIFLNAKLEKQSLMSPDQIFILFGGNQSKHMITALCAVAEDLDSTLIQRYLLNFLSVIFPLNGQSVSKEDLILILQRCLFVVLKREASLNRRLYQWLLNRSNDRAFANNPVNETEETGDMKFFKDHALPLVKQAIKDFLKNDVVEIASTSLIGASTLRAKDTQLHFVEVRVFRLLYYLMNRREVGTLILNETLAMILEFACHQDFELICELNQQCEELDSLYVNIWDVFSTSDKQLKNRRVEETKKTFNALLEFLEPNFLWQFLEEYLNKLFFKEIEIKKGNTFKSLDDATELFVDCEIHLKYYPLIVAFCLKIVDLDSSNEIRGRFLPKLLRTILIKIRERGFDSICRDVFVALLVVARRLLHEINQSVAVFENEKKLSNSVSFDRSDAKLFSPSKKESKNQLKKCIEEQELVELCLQACFELLSDVCEWYLKDRENDKLGIICTISALVRDFADFPFYCFQPNKSSNCEEISSICNIFKSSNNSSNNHPMWLVNLISVVNADSWLKVSNAQDFDIRVQTLDLILYLYVRSASVIDQHLAVYSRTFNNLTCYSSTYSNVSEKTTTTVLLKPFFSKQELTKLENENLFTKSAKVLWARLENTADTLQTAAFLLLRLHSRRINEASSEVEDIIVFELTSPNKIISGSAAKKFRNLWVFCRSAGLEDVYAGVPLKPMNRVVMVLLGFIADDLVGTERIELRAIAYAWFVDCSRHNDLHKILQMLLLMLVNPATARVSIQFVHIDSRITREQIPSMPIEANAISLATDYGQQKFHHVCKDIDIRLSENSIQSNISPWNNFTYVDCDNSQQWVDDLNKQLLLPSNTFAENTHQLVTPTLLGNNGRKVPSSNCHKRTMSDIPQFDEDAESVGSLSLESSIEHDIFEVVQFIVDTVIENEVTIEKGDTSLEGSLTTDKIPNFESPVNSFLLKQDNIKNDLEKTNDYSLLANEHTVHKKEKILQSSGFKNFLVKEQPNISLCDSNITLGNAAVDGGNTIKRIKCGHRRQDSLQESIFSTTTNGLRLFDPTELPSTTCPGDSKQPLLDETHSHMLFYAESPRIVDLGRAEKIFRTIGALLKSGYSLGRHIVNCLIFTNTIHLKVNGSSQLVDYMVRHYRHMQGCGFWIDDTDLNNTTNNNPSNNSVPTIIPGSDKTRNPTMFEIFATVLLYYFRSYYLNSPTNYVSEADLIMSWKCKIAALDCFTELLRILNDIVKEVNSRDFVIFVQQIYRFTRTQRAVIALMLTAVPSPPSQKNWRMPITVDIAEFNNGPQKNLQFRDLIFAYHRSLLNLSFSIIVLEYNMQMGVKNFTVQSLGFVFERPMENRQFYNSPANRSTIRDPRYMVVELRMFISVILNALKRCPERHELWLQFLISVVPYLDRALPTFAVHVVEQICRNIYTFISLSMDSGLSIVQNYNNTMDSPRSLNNFTGVNNFKTAFYFADFRIPKKEIINSNSENSLNCATQSPNNTSSVFLRYPANYALMESLMSILHFCTIDSAAVSMPFLIAKTSNNHHVYTTHHHTASSMFGTSSILLNQNNLSSALSGTHSNLSGSNSGGSSNMVGSMVGSAISSLPGTTAISNLFGKVFTSGDNSNHANANANPDLRGISESWITSQKELLKIFPSALAILCDVWSFSLSKKNCLYQSNPAICNSEVLASLVIDTLNPIAKKHTNVLINAFGIVWISRQRINSFAPKQPSFVYSSQQICVAKLLLSLKVLSINSIIMAIAEILKELASKLTKSSAEKNSGFLSEVALLEMLHECTRQISVNDLRESWSALNILFNETPLSMLPARASFLQFVILSDFVRRCGSQAIIEDRQINRPILEVCQKLTDAVNSIVGWQLETTTWLKRTLVVKQDASSQKICDISPTFDLKSGSVPSGIATSEISSMRGSTISLATQNNRMSSIDGISQFNGSVAQLSINSSDTQKKSATNLRSSVKGDSSVNKKDPHDSTQALFLLSENLAELIDSICKSDDKEKLLPILHAVWANTLPYLKAKSAKNVRFFLASSQFLASMSIYNYMRPVWKKATMELLLDSAFFKMDIYALKHWLVVIDNLMTNDKISFKELLVRITTGTSSSLTNLITSKEQEYEMRAQSLKRLAFVILSSEIDQYSSQLNEIQERLSENLRVSQVPVVHVQVFMCYRVLLIRMRPMSFVSMWPSMVTELVQVLLQIEQQLNLLNYASSTITNAGSGEFDLKCSRDDHWMQLYLAACKLLETLCTLPCGYVTQFQMCRWAFVSALNSNSIADLFIPFAVRINSLLNAKYSELLAADRELRSASLFNIKTLTSFQELHPFFNVLATQHTGLQNSIQYYNNSSIKIKKDIESKNTYLNGYESENIEGQFRDANMINGLLTLKNAIARIEQSLYVDFADHWQL